MTSTPPETAEAWRSAGTYPEIIKKKSVLLWSNLFFVVR